MVDWTSDDCTLFSLMKEKFRNNGHHHHRYHHHHHLTQNPDTKKPRLALVGEASF